jgi:1-deoxy-D-xylulose-5-phosphate reductoisomerase
MTGNTEKRVTILGSTGSIGKQTMEIIDFLGGYRVTAITANGSVELLEQQARKFRPKLAVLRDEKAAKDLAVRLSDTDVKVASGESGIVEAAELDTDILVSSIVGNAGLVPTMAGIKRGNRRIALANKETLVCAGHLFMSAIKENNCELIPVDSEHSAIWQSLKSGKHEEIKRILLTASGGPFRTMPIEKLYSVKKENALKHPNWSMGAKITIDSATMMNKGLEVMEAMHLFDVPVEKIKVVVHPQSIVHSAVEFCDNAIIAQMGSPDMRIPIQLALTYPDRVPSLAPPAELTQLGTLTFEEPDLEKFGCLKLALSIAGRHDAAPIVMNGANEEAVGLFLKDKIGFMDICEKVSEAVEALGNKTANSIDEVLTRDMEAREYVLKN